MLQLVYSDDEEVECIKFTRDFYRLVNLRSNSTPSLQSQIDSEESSNVKEPLVPSPTPSEAGRAQIQSCSSSDSGDFRLANDIVVIEPKATELLDDRNNDASDVKEIVSNTGKVFQLRGNKIPVATYRQGTSHSWRRSNGWTKVSNGKLKVRNLHVVIEQFNGLILFLQETSLSPNSSPTKTSIPPPIPIRRTLAR